MNEDFYIYLDLKISKVYLPLPLNKLQSCFGEYTF
jgi:hypothetical protein